MTQGFFDASIICSKLQAPALSMLHAVAYQLLCLLHGLMYRGLKWVFLCCSRRPPPPGSMNIKRNTGWPWMDIKKDSFKLFYWKQPSIKEDSLKLFYWKQYTIKEDLLKVFYWKQHNIKKGSFKLFYWKQRSIRKDSFKLFTENSTTSRKCCSENCAASGKTPSSCLLKTAQHQESVVQAGGLWVFFFF